MTTIKLTFPWGRYYAHKWRIQSEVEWPPSHWRLLRALVSAWFKAHPGQEPCTECISLVESLGRELPAIGFGKVSFGQSVHFQPNYKEAGPKERARGIYTNKRHENHFTAVHGPVFFRWPKLELPPEQRRLLEALLAELTYFGRAESLCHAEVCDIEPSADTGWCQPTEGRKISATCRDVFCPKPGQAEDGSWHFQFTDLWMRRADVAKHNPDNAPPHFVDTLLSSTMKADGAEWRSYLMPTDWPHKRLVRTPRWQRSPNEQPMNLSTDPRKVAHYLRFSLQCRVPIPKRFTVDIAERFRAAANSRIPQGVKSFALLGKQEDRPEDLVGQHKHAFFLPTAEDSSLPGFLTDVHIWCPMGFTRSEVDLFLKVRRLGWKDHRYPANPVLVAIAMQPPADAIISTSHREKPSRTWRSATPFVPALHFYTGSKNKPRFKVGATPEKQLMDAVRTSGVTTACTVQRLRFSNQRPNGLVRSESLTPQLAWDVVRAPAEADAFNGGVETKTHRNGSDDRDGGHRRRIGFMLELEFDEPVILPQPAFGHSCHFGLGLFTPIKDP